MPIKSQTQIDLESIEKIKKQIIPKDITISKNNDLTNMCDLNTLSIPNINPIIDDDFRLIENLDEITSLLTDETVCYDFYEPKQTQENSQNFETNLIYMDKGDQNFQNIFSQQNSKPVSNSFVTIDPNNTSNFEQIVQQKQKTTTRIDDDQDKKIKALADNIIAAMPYKIKSNSYSNSAQTQQKASNTNFDGLYSSGSSISNQNYALFDTQTSFNNLSDQQTSNFLHRNASSFDDSYDSTRRSFNDPRISFSSYHSSSTRSSLSPTASHSFQFNNQNSNSEFSYSGNYDHSRIIDDSPGDDSTCSSTFHIDSPPSTAEFCQYFHASSSSSYFKNAIEKGFSQLTLTDDEQRELYEAALIIQNAYRRYILRKKKK